MMRFKLKIPLIAAGLLLASCALIPAQGIGPNALGLQGTEVTVGTPPAVVGFSQLATRSATEAFTFQDIDPPDLPIGPSSLQAVQGFEPTVTVYGSATLPGTISIDSGTLVVTISDDSGTPDAVTAEANFGPFTLNRSDSCAAAASECAYTFADADAAAKSLTVSISGSDLSRLIQIITEGDANNTITLNLTLETAVEVDAMRFTIDVEENYIRF